MTQFLGIRVNCVESLHIDHCRSFGTQNQVNLRTHLIILPDTKVHLHPNTSGEPCVPGTATVGGWD